MGKAFDSVDGNMDILMYNNTVKKIKDVRKGDTVFSVRYDGEAYQYVKGEVTSINKRKGKAVKITLNDGIRSTLPHWLYCTSVQRPAGLRYQKRRQAALQASG